MMFEPYTLGWCLALAALGGAILFGIDCAIDATIEAMDWTFKKGDLP